MQTVRFTKLSVIIPAYNEGRTVHLVLDQVRQVVLRGGIRKEVIVVNDGSGDDTEAAILRYRQRHPEMDLQYYKHAANQGKGAALRTGISRATGEYLVIQDADLEYDPHEYNLLIGPVLGGVADVVYGSRFAGRNPPRGWFSWHTAGNKFLTFLSNRCTRLQLTDMETCYKLFNTSLVQQLTLRENRFGFEPEVTAKIARLPGVRMYEVGISYHRRRYAEGKKITWRDGIRAIYCIFKYSNGFTGRAPALTPTPAGPRPGQEPEVAAVAHPERH
ncbi:MAG TPA: glycosyltransferase family 2 protein [Cytophagales bacterium]|jgi:glycosyltransferase involved in cell wall biosynthesis